MATKLQIIVHISKRKAVLFWLLHNNFINLQAKRNLELIEV
jgi:hypothetical protein